MAFANTAIQHVRGWTNAPWRNVTGSGALLMLAACGGDGGDLGLQ